MSVQPEMAKFFALYIPQKSTFKGEILIESVYKAPLSVIPGVLTSMLFLLWKKKITVIHYDQFPLLNSIVNSNPMFIIF